MEGFFEEQQNALKEKFDEVLEGAEALGEQAWEELTGSLDEAKEVLDELDRDIAEGVGGAVEKATELIPPIKEFLAEHNHVVANLISLVGMLPHIPAVPKRILEKIDALVADLDPYSDDPEDVIRDVRNLKYVIDELYRPVVRMAIDSWKSSNEASFRLLLSAMELALKKRDRFRRSTMKGGRK